MLKTQVLSRDWNKKEALLKFWEVIIDQRKKKIASQAYLDLSSFTLFVEIRFTFFLSYFYGKVT